MAHFGGLSFVEEIEMSFEGVKQIALEKLMKQLDVFGVEYAIIANGTQYGNLEVIVQSEEPERRRNSKRFEHVRALVHDKLIKMVPGDVTVFETPADLEADQYRSHISNQARKLWGPADISYTTTVDQAKRIVELMRLA